MTAQMLDRFCPLGDRQFPVNMLNVAFHRIARNKQLFRNFTAVQAPAQPNSVFHFPARSAGWFSLNFAQQ